MGSIVRRGVCAVLLCVSVPAVATAQNPAWDRTMLDVHLGQGWFFDESAIRHDVVGVGASRTVSSRLWLGADLTLMRGPGKDRDVLLLAHVTFDIIEDRSTHPVVPFVALGAGAMRYTNTLYGRDIAETGIAALLTIGVRVRIGDRWFVAPEAAMGLGPQARLGITVGVRR